MKNKGIRADIKYNGNLIHVSVKGVVKHTTASCIDAINYIKSKGLFLNKKDQEVTFGWLMHELREKSKAAFLGISGWQSLVGICSATHGWRDKGGRNVGELIALCHSELSEALEELRTPKPVIYYDEAGKKPEGVVVELADCIIRIMDLCDEQGWDLQSALAQKFRYNTTRPYRHGNKRF